MYDLVDKYTNELFNSPDFLRLLELKGIIDKKYSKEIVSFKTNEAKYLELKEYENYNIGLDSIKEAFIESKRRLYSEPEVVEYFKLEAKIQARINEDMNSLKASISNKFKANKSFFLDL